MSIKTKLKNIGDAIRFKLSETSEYTLDEMPTKIKSISSNKKAWTRPDEWPNLDSLDLSDYEDCILYTYDNSEKDGRCWWSVNAYCGNSVGANDLKIDIGTIEDGEFVIESTTYGKPRTTINDFFSTTYDYPVVRITSTQPITSIYVDSSPAFPEGDKVASNYPNTVEARIKGTNLKTLTSSSSSGSKIIPIQTVRVRIENVTQITSLENILCNNYAIQEFDWDDSNDTSNVTTLHQSFQNCTAIKDWSFLKKFDTSNVLIFSNLFYNTTFDSFDYIKDWDFSKATTFKHMFFQCTRLQKIDLSEKASEFSNVTTIQSMFQNCTSLQELNMSGFDMTNIANVTAAFNNLPVLREFYPPSNMHLSFTLNSGSLSYASVMRTINSLQTVTDAQIYTGGVSFYKISADEVAIGTEKGWTMKRS